MESTEKAKATAVTTENLSIVKGGQKRGVPRGNHILLDIYSPALLTKRLAINISDVDKNITSTLQNKLKFECEGKCIVDGYVKKNSIRLTTYSSGIVSGQRILFDVSFECLVCCPVEGTIVKCVAKNITKAGIRAESATETPSPIVIFIARDHNFNNTKFTKIKENDEFFAKIIGMRYELNDIFVSIIAEVAESTHRQN